MPSVFSSAAVSLGAGLGLDNTREHAAIAYDNNDSNDNNDNGGGGATAPSSSGVAAHHRGKARPRRRRPVSSSSTTGGMRRRGHSESGSFVLLPRIEAMMLTDDGDDGGGESRRLPASRFEAMRLNELLDSALRRTRNRAVSARPRMSIAEFERQAMDHNRSVSAFDEPHHRRTYDAVLCAMLTTAREKFVHLSNVQRMANKAEQEPLMAQVRAFKAHMNECHSEMAEKTKAQKQRAQQKRAKNEEIAQMLDWNANILEAFDRNEHGHGGHGHGHDGQECSSGGGDAHSHHDAHHGMSSQDLLKLVAEEAQLLHERFDAADKEWKDKVERLESDFDDTKYDLEATLRQLAELQDDMRRKNEELDAQRDRAERLAADAQKWREVADGCHKELAQATRELADANSFLDIGGVQFVEEENDDSSNSPPSPAVKRKTSILAHALDLADPTGPTPALGSFQIHHETLSKSGSSKGRLVAIDSIVLKWVTERLKEIQQSEAARKKGSFYSKAAVKRLETDLCDGAVYELLLGVPPTSANKGGLVDADRCRAALEKVPGLRPEVAAMASSMPCGEQNTKLIHAAMVILIMTQQDTIAKRVADASKFLDDVDEDEEGGEAADDDDDDEEEEDRARQMSLLTKISSTHRQGLMKLPRGSNKGGRWHRGLKSVNVFGGSAKHKARAEREDVVCQLVADIYRGKADEDRVNATNGKEARRMDIYCRDFMLMKYGIKSLADNALANLATGIQKYCTKSSRIRLFGKFVGVIKVAKQRSSSAGGGNGSGGAKKRKRRGHHRQSGAARNTTDESSSPAGSGADEHPHDNDDEGDAAPDAAAVDAEQKDAQRTMRKLKQPRASEFALKILSDVIGAKVLGTFLGTGGSCFVLKEKLDKSIDLHFHHSRDVVLPDLRQRLEALTAHAPVHPENRAPQLNIDDALEAIMCSWLEEDKAAQKVLRVEAATNVQTLFRGFASRCSVGVMQDQSREKAEEAELRALFAEADANSDGVLNLKEFRDMVKRLDTPLDQTKIINIFSTAVYLSLKQRRKIARQSSGVELSQEAMLASTESLWEEATQSGERSDDSIDIDAFIKAIRDEGIERDGKGRWHDASTKEHAAFEFKRGSLFPLHK